MDDKAILEDITERIIDERVYPYLAERIDSTIGLSPADLRTLGLDGWDAPRLARTITQALLTSPSLYAMRFRKEAVALAYDPHEPIDAYALDLVLFEAYPPKKLVNEAMLSAARFIGEHPDGPAFRRTV
jgi:hypothetical protein